jgi:hypothetical protein
MNVGSQLSEGELSLAMNSSMCRTYDYTRLCCLISCHSSVCLFFSPHKISTVVEWTGTLNNECHFHFQYIHNATSISYYFIQYILTIINCNIYKLVMPTNHCYHRK